MINIAKNKYDYENVEFVVGDVLNTELHIKQFDFIICNSMFPHFNDKRNAIKILSKYLNKNGKIVICHTQSRTEINVIHKRIFGSIDNIELPPMKLINNYFKENHLKTVLQIDNQIMFFVIGQKLPCKYD